MTTPITIDSLSRIDADGAGGQLLDVVGDFAGEFGKAYQIHIGPAGDYTDTACFSGIIGSPRILYPMNDVRLRGYLPPLTEGVYNVYVRRVDMTRATLLSGVMSVRPPMFYTSVFDLRMSLPPYYKTGPRNIEMVAS